MSTTRIAVLIPCLNEEQTIEKVVKDFQEQLPEALIYVYDNASTDQTNKVAKKAGAMVKTSPERGKGLVIRQMFREVDADIYVLVDGDDTYPANRVQELVALIQDKGYDMV
ncbi:MAG: glycosyltransferase, partial [Bacteroidota bacterium]